MPLCDLARLRLLLPIGLLIASFAQAASNAQAGPAAERALKFPWANPQSQLSFDGNAASATRWTASGGELAIRFNEDMLKAHGVAVRGLGGARNGQGRWLLPIADSETVRFSVAGTQFQEFVAGGLALGGGFELRQAGKRLLLDALRLVPVHGKAWQLQLTDVRGHVWFVSEHMHYQLSPGWDQLALFNMDLRAGARFAEWLGEPLLQGQAIGEMEALTRVRMPDGIGLLDKSCSAPNWPNQPRSTGELWQADVTLIDIDDIDWKRCDGCAGNVGPADGRVVFAPSATLRNSTADNAADVPWHEKFSGYNAPHNNDQHPYLIWNLYRLNADGSFEQIARSGVKHAFLTTNITCTDPSCQSGNVLGKGCMDTYSSGNNDGSINLGPRREVVPARGIWGRCGSIFDVNCDHVANNLAVDSYRDRLVVNESQLRSLTNPGATYFMDAWYIVRDDRDIYNTMGYVRVQPVFTNTWQLGISGPFTTGPAINAWVNPTAPGANATNVEIATPEGRVRVAAKASLLANGLWRYDYALMNIDFSRAQVERVGVANQPAAEVFRVGRNFGFSAFEIASRDPQAATVEFSDGDLSAGNDWTVDVDKQRVRWQGGENRTLDWGTLYSFSLQSRRAPGPALGVLQILDPGKTPSLSAMLIGPTGAPE